MGAPIFFHLASHFRLTVPSIPGALPAARRCASLPWDRHVVSARLVPQPNHLGLT
jgi:hypothetical protein